MLEIEDIIVAKGIHAAVEADDTSVLQILTQEARARIAGNGRTAADVLASLRGSLRGAIVSEILKATTVQRLHDLIDSTLVSPPAQWQHMFRITGYDCLASVLHC